MYTSKHREIHKEKGKKKQLDVTKRGGEWKGAGLWNTNDCMKKISN